MAESNRYSQAEIVDALETILRALTLADNETPAFQEVKRFDVESLTEAFELLLMSEQRVCIVVVLDETFEPELDGDHKLLVKRLLPIALLISDRRLGDRVKALWGEAEDPTVPGAFALAEIALPAVTGRLLENTEAKDGVVVQPFDIQSIFLRDTDKQDLPGRAAVKLELHCKGGTLEANLGVGPTL